ncbi:uncharacterized protein A1O9_11925 [Exophiala aquamarina CBS 119918]|uniref:FAD-binding PCMH-type domain-containing protein n=1 Tax=Exophiala aquamarina CBS 119918 TaxID=1182545 RepID=A0A072P8N7_9EURO|nr:uncharacterized protein A1O9_11925 [Exophiala aquamarina CBS 119918]KEF51935.1 hypothetical protein A1O9_11925 [Exophiala aquamarina CBS 119918]
MADKDNQTEGLKSLLTSQEIVDPSSPDYQRASRTWSAHANLRPGLVIQPKDVPTLSKSISYLANTALDFRVRCTGVGNASAKDVLVSLAAFKSFSFNPDDDTITFGAGHTWGEIDQKVEKHAPGYAALSARCRFVGVGGSILHGGQSWLSHQYGLASDPQNLLDVQVIKMDGTVLWASEEPELLWAMRGGGGGFAVATAYKMRVYKYPSSIFCGQIIYPADAMPIVARETAAFIARCSDPKIALHLYCLDMTQGSMTSKEPKPGISIFAYDANGEEHGRSADGFKWALDIEGAIDMTHAVNFRQVNESFGKSQSAYSYGVFADADATTDALEAHFGVTNTWQAGVTVPEATEQLITDAWNWYLALKEQDPMLVKGTYVLLEMMQKAAYQSLGYPSTATAWPHTRNRHNLQLGTGIAPGNPKSDALAYKAMAEGPYQIRPEHTGGNYFPNFIEEYVNAEKV